MTKIGVISDSHDNLFAMREALKVFQSENVDFIFHCGDMVAPFALKVLLEAETPLRIVFGNNDGERIVNRTLIEKHSAHKLAEWVLVEEIDGRSIAMTHGHVPEMVDCLLKSDRHDIVLTGHTHQRVETVLDNGVLHVNPGETCGWVTGHASIAIIELEPISVSFKDIDFLPK